MKHITTVVIGAGQAGLAMSHCLSSRGVPHVVLERGEVAQSWRAQRWDSLRLLTPNWQSRFPGFAYSGPEPDGFMTMTGIVGHLERYAAVAAAPIETRTAVRSVTAEGRGYRVETTRGTWGCDSLVLATGACARAAVPDWAQSIPPTVTQLTPLDYRGPGQLPAGGVLVVGASASGMQLAAEFCAAGHQVYLSVGQHIRVPRRYRGRDIQWWMDRAGMLSTPVEKVDDIDRARRVPSLQLSGSYDAPFLDLNALQASGVEVVGRLAAIRDGEALFSGSLANHCAMSDLKMNRLLDGIDAWAAANEPAGLEPARRFGPTQVPDAPRLRCDLSDGRIRTIVWATGFRPDFGWMHLPVFDRKGGLLHDRGRVAPGIHVLGLPFLRRRNSALIDGVGADAEAVADHIVQDRGRRAA